MAAQYVIGIDLGTTNCVVAFASLESDAPKVELLEIPQLTSVGTVENRASLPSFLYLPTASEVEQDVYQTDWNSGSDVAGELARRNSADVADRTVGGAKSWLGYEKVDRRQPILPWQAPSDVPKVSPVEATRRYLEHLVAAWTKRFPDAPLGEQQVVITVPASFDASARDLTREAAVGAGIPADHILLEEPQAAMYAWLERTGDDWRKAIGVGNTLLVCDVGGGTTDFTLIDVIDQDGELELHRRAVGNHLLVGGDNMDLAIAYLASQKFGEQGVTLDPWQSISLWHSCRAGKEQLLGSEQAKTIPLSVKKKGSKLVGGNVSVELEQAAVQQMLLEGFFPQCDVQDRPQEDITAGFQELGLPFESDTGITRHMAAFLADQGEDQNPVTPTHLLFNGGVFKSPLFRDRIRETLQIWHPDQQLTMLESLDSLDHAVARGATFYAWSKCRGGVRIRGGTPRAYYVGIQTAGLAIPGAPRPLKAVCVVPHGMEEGTECDVPSAEVGLVVGKPARFRFFGSPSRKEDQPGDTLTQWSTDELAETAPLETTLTADGELKEPFLPVRFKSKVTELGVLELWCVSTKSDDQWKLEFSVRESNDG